MPGTIDPRISVSLVCARSWPTERTAAFLAGLGIANVSATMAHAGPDPAALASTLRGAGLATVMLGTGGIDIIGEDVETRAWLDPLIDAAQPLDCPDTFIVSGPAALRLPTDHAFDRLVTRLGPAVAAARARDVVLSVEHSGPATRALGFVSSLADACDLAEATGCGVIVELQNCWYERRLPALFCAHAARFRMVQVSDFTVGEELRFNRKVPGEGDIPLEWLIGELLEAGYAGGFELEFLGPAIEAEGYDSAIPRGIEWLAERLARWGA